MEIDSVRLDRLQNLNILVIGDLMLDRYHWGRVDRVSPEAPVPVVDVFQEENRLGGAANVARNLNNLGCKPILCGVVGQDTEGEIFQALMEQDDLSRLGIVATGERRTTTKTRILGGKQQILRIDKEDRDYLPGPLRKQFQQEVRRLMHELSVDAIIFEDYDKGLLSPEFIQNIVSIAREKSILTFVDPKFRQFHNYAGVTVFKPNLKELSVGVKENLQLEDLDAIRMASMSLKKRMPHEYTFVTLSENGVALIDKYGNLDHAPAHFRKIIDVSGAGDTVIGVMAAFMAAGYSARLAARLANLAGGLVCEEVGVVPVDAIRMEAEMRKVFPLEEEQAG